jgi:hypothetical protein
MRVKDLERTFKHTNYTPETLESLNGVAPEDLKDYDIDAEKPVDHDTWMEGQRVLSFLRSYSSYEPPIPDDELDLIEIKSRYA